MAFLVSHPVTEFSPQQVDPGSRSLEGLCLTVLQTCTEASEPVRLSIGIFAGVQRCLVEERLELCESWGRASLDVAWHR